MEPWSSGQDIGLNTRELNKHPSTYPDKTFYLVSLNHGKTLKQTRVNVSYTKILSGKENALLSMQLF